MASTWLVTILETLSIINVIAKLIKFNVIGGLLSKVERLKGVWENIGNDVRAAIAESDKQFLNILSLSYNHLPLHLKPCFLYMAAFPEDYEIKASRLIQMWVAEGFVKSNGDKSLEEEAEDYLKSLVERNLVSVITSYNWYEKAETYKMHDLLRDLCIRKADDEKFVHVKNSTFSNQLRRVSIHTSYGMEDIDDKFLHVNKSIMLKKKKSTMLTFSNQLLRRVSIHTSLDKYASSSQMSLVRSFLLLIELDRNVLPMVFTLRLLRVLDLLENFINEFPKEILQLVNLRYLAINCKSLPRRGISRLCNLQTLIADLDAGSCPAELWEMSELRHLIMLGEYLKIKDDYMKKIILKKLQTIWGLKLRRYGLLSVIRSSDPLNQSLSGTIGSESSSLVGPESLVGPSSSSSHTESLVDPFFLFFLFFELPKPSKAFQGHELISNNS